MNTWGITLSQISSFPAVPVTAFPGARKFQKSNKLHFASSPAEGLSFTLSSSSPILQASFLAPSVSRLHSISPCLLWEVHLLGSSTCVSINRKAGGQGKETPPGLCRDQLEQVKQLLAAAFIPSQAWGSWIELWLLLQCKRSKPEKVLRRIVLDAFLSLHCQDRTAVATANWYCSSEAVREAVSMVCPRQALKCQRILLPGPVTAEVTTYFHTGGSVGYSDWSETTARLWIITACSLHG